MGNIDTSSSIQPDGPITIELLKKKCKINLINASCNKAIKKNKVNFVYPSKEELMLLDDESRQNTKKRYKRYG